MSEHDDSVIGRLMSELDKMYGESLSHKMTASRSAEARDYCKRYGVADWGGNLWHAILDDAIRLRKCGAK